jgi:CheY-like chemotaxis protein
LRVAKILCVDDYPLYAEMVGTMLQQKGHHEVKVDVVPLVIDEIIAFAPDVIVVNLVRRTEALGVALHDYYRAVEGAKALKAIAAAPELQSIPVILTALAVNEIEVPDNLRYEAFVVIPQRLDSLLRAIERLTRSSQKGSEVAPQ